MQQNSFDKPAPEEQSSLGKKISYECHYNPDLLFVIPRKHKRDEIGIPGNLPFYGFDLWNHYEVSWLNRQGKPVVATAVIAYDCYSPNMVESKSMKLYFNSLNNTKFSDVAAVRACIAKDIADRVGAPVMIEIRTAPWGDGAGILRSCSGICLDNHDIECSVYNVEPAFLVTENEIVDETVYSDLLKSNCAVTGQPDWGSVQIAYSGKKINHEGLLRYIVSFRNHNEFHEQCIERIFMDIQRSCHPENLTVYGRYTRRGGVDINPYRSTKEIVAGAGFIMEMNNRMQRQ